jgi:hypothetical protein
MIILSNIMDFSKNTILNYIISKKYLLTIIFIILTCLNYIIIDKTWMHKFMYVKYLSISKDLSQINIKHREHIINIFASSFNRNNSNPNLSIMNLKNSYDIKLFFFSSLNNDEVNKLIDEQINKTILDVKDGMLSNLNFIENETIPIWANSDNLLRNKIKNQKILIEKLSEKIKNDLIAYEETVNKILEKNKIIKMNNSGVNFSQYEKLLKILYINNFVKNIKNFIRDTDLIFMNEYILKNNNTSKTDYLNIYTYQQSRAHIQLLKDLTFCSYYNLTSMEHENLCSKQKNIFASTLDYFYYVLTLKNIINTKNNFYLKSINKIKASWKNENIIDYDNEMFYEIDRIGPSNMLIIIISIFNSLVLTTILSLLLINLNNKSNIFKN